jgi:two-component system CheB/CheR fusion protein
MHPKFQHWDCAGRMCLFLASGQRTEARTSKADDVDLAEVIRLELRAYAAGQDGRVTIAGPSVALSFDRVQVLALALHELTTNAVKYGALKEETGQPQIRWAVEDGADGGPLPVVDWRESGVTMPPDISRRGYGRKLIERALTYTARAKTQLTFGDDGVSCWIEMPLAVRRKKPASPEVWASDAGVPT